MSKRIFISIGFPDKGECLPDVDRILMKDMLISIAQHADKHGHTIILRDHPAIVPMMEVLLSGKGQIEIIPEQPYHKTGIQTPDVVFFIGGASDSLNDYNHLAFHNPEIPLYPMHTTGGAAVEIEHDMELNDTLHPILRSERNDAFGFYALHSLMQSLIPPTAPPAHKPPSPSF